MNRINSEKNSIFINSLSAQSLYSAEKGSKSTLGKLMGKNIYAMESASGGTEFKALTNSQARNKLGAEWKTSQITADKVNLLKKGILDSAEKGMPLELNSKLEFKFSEASLVKGQAVSANSPLTQKIRKTFVSVRKELNVQEEVKIGDGISVSGGTYSKIINQGLNKQNSLKETGSKTNKCMIERSVSLKNIIITTQNTTYVAKVDENMVGGFKTGVVAHPIITANGKIPQKQFFALYPPDKQNSIEDEKKNNNLVAKAISSNPHHLGVQYVANPDNINTISSEINLKISQNDTLYNSKDLEKIMNNQSIVFTDVSGKTQELPLTPEIKNLILFQVSAGVNFLNENQIYHRDLHLGNLMLDSEVFTNKENKEQVKITAKVIDYGLVLSNDKSKKPTQLSNRVAAPESYGIELTLDDKNYNDKMLHEYGDRYALGLMILQIKTNSQLKMLGTDRDELMEKRVQLSNLLDNPNSSSSNNVFSRAGLNAFKNLNPEEQELIKKLLSLKPSERPSAAEVSEFYKKNIPINEFSSRPFLPKESNLGSIRNMGNKDYGQMHVPRPSDVNNKTEVNNETQANESKNSNYSWMLNDDVNSMKLNDELVSSYTKNHYNVLDLGI